MWWGSGQWKVLVLVRGSEERIWGRRRENLVSWREP